METYNQEGLNIVVNSNPKTPRTAICCYFSIENKPKYTGIVSLIARLLVRGTKKRSAEELTLELQNSGIELYTEGRQDYLKTEILFLNQDFNQAKEILHDVIENSTFKELEKEIFKIKSEITATLDSSVSKIADKFTKTLYEDHHYGTTLTQALEEIDNIKFEHIKEFYEILLKAKKSIVVIGDFEDEKQVLNDIKNEFSFLQKYENICSIKDFEGIKEDKIVKIVKNSANQAHIYQGWITDKLDGKDFPKLIVMNNLMGSSGLSSRLFYELRDKQGLAYTVRSVYESRRHAGNINFYIGTSPKNIKKSLDGFREEITKLQNNLPTEEELQGAKENILGRLAYFSQTNIQQAGTIAADLMFDRDANYRKKYIELINSVTCEDLSEMARKYLSGKSIIAVIAPGDYLDF